jgi:hypothetical protein
MSVRTRTDADRLQISGPTELAVEAAPGALKTLPILRRVGLYAIEGAVPPHDRLAVSVLSDVESDLRPGGELTVNAEAVVAGEAGAAAPRALWPWFVAAALLVLVVEWLAYCRLLGM